MSQKACKHCDILYRHLHSDTVVDCQTSVMIESVHTNVTKHDNTGDGLKNQKIAKYTFEMTPHIATVADHALLVSTV